jgi:hypothetical protein
MMHNLVVAPRLHRPRTALAKAATILGVYAAAALGGGLIPFLALPGNMPFMAVAFVFVVALVVGQQLVQASSWSALGGALAGFALMFTTFYGVPLGVLAWRGQTIQATVISVQTSRYKASTTYFYGLADARLRRLPGHLSEDSNYFAVGEEVMVVTDPNGMIDPQTPGEVGAVRPIWIANAISFAVTALMALWIANSRPRGRAPRHGVGGLWIYDR